MDDAIPEDAAAHQDWARQLFLHSPSIIFIKDLQGHYIDVNPAFERLVRVPRAKALGRTDEEIFPPEIAKAFREDDLKVIASGKAMQFEERTDMVGGPSVSLTHKFPLFDARGEMIATAGILSDFTERKLAEDKLAASEWRYAALFEHMHDAMVLIDDAGGYRDANPAALQLLGRTREEALRLRVGDVTSAPAPTMIRDHLRALLEHGHASGDFVLRRPNGEVCDAEFKAVANVTPGLHMVVVRDITAQKRAQAELRKGEERFRLLFESSPLPMFGLDVHTRRFAIVNDAAVHLYGYSHAEFAILSAADVTVAEEWPATQAALDSLELGQRFVSRMRHLKRDGSVIEVMGYHHVTEMSGRMTLLASIVDRTERNQARRERDRYRARLQQVTRRMLTLQDEERVAIAGDLHDHVGQCLSALGIQLGMLQALLPDAAPRVQQILQESASVLEDAGLATRNVIAELRPEALRDFGVAAALRNLAARSWTRFHFRIDIDAPEPALRAPAAVEAALLRVCQEALANVAKHAQAGRVRITYRARPRGVVLHIADDGQGFERSSRDRPACWGLLMMRERAESVGALLRVRTRPGKGTDVTIRWRERRAHARPAR